MQILSHIYSIIIEQSSILNYKYNQPKIDNNILIQIANQGMKKKKIENFIILLDDVLGSGSFGKVYRGIQDTTKQVVAIKVLLKKEIDQDIYVKNALFSEIKIMRNMSSANIVGFIDVLETGNNYYIVQEFCNGGDLRGVMKVKKVIPELEALHYLEGILNGFTQLILRGITHRDVKPENILLHDKVVKIADFGFSKNVLSKSHLFKTMVGTPLYMAPQILKQQRYSSKCDIWAIGVLYYEMLYGRLPWNGKTQYELVTNILKTPLSFSKEPQISEASKNFITGCLKISESQRFSWEEVYSHPLFNNKFEFFTNKTKRMQQKALYIFSNLRVLVHSENIDLEKLFENFKLMNGDVLKKEEFFEILTTLDDKMTKEEAIVLFESMDPDSKGVIDFTKFKNKLSQSGIRMKSLTPQMSKKNKSQQEGQTESTNDPESEKIIELIIKLRQKIESHKLNLFKVYSSYDRSKSDALSIEEFSKLMTKIDGSLTENEVQLCFKKFDLNGDGKISFEEFYKTICKIAGEPSNLKKNN